MNDKPQSFASAIVIWEACNALAQRQSLPWEADESGNLCYRRQVNGGKGEITLCIADAVSLASAESEGTDETAIATWDVRAACLHLIYAAYATSLERPWEQSFTISDQEISDYLGLGKRKDLSKLAKLTLIKDLAEQPCKLLVAVNWAHQSKFKPITIPQSHIWHLSNIQHHFQEDDLGSQHLTGLTFTITAGQWAQVFLNRNGSREGATYYQYGTLPKSLLTTVMSIWQQHEGSVRMILWLLFKTRMGVDQPITVSTLMRIAYGEKRLVKAYSQREERKRLLRSFESDLEALNHYGLKPVFDPSTYPLEIQPLWVKLMDLPDDAEAALEFWTNDGSNNHRLTDAAPRNKWQRLMNARLLKFELPEDWAQPTTKSSKKPSRDRKHSSSKSPLSGQQIATARKNRQLSQRVLADKLGKSQSWIRDIESGRLKLSEKDQAMVAELLF